MEFGIAIPIHRNVKPHANIEIAKKAEEMGFNSIWTSDHVVVPNRYTDGFSEIFYDPFVLLASTATHTDKIKLGTSVIILPYRNPIVMAKMIATLDVLSNGRFIFGVGPGWMKEEFDVLGATFEERGRRTDEYIKIFKELCEKDEPRFEGEYFRFSDIKFFPKPYQRPYPPIWIGGSSKRAIRRAVELGDGWQPIWFSPDEMEVEINYLKRVASEMGRNLEQFVFSIRNRLRILSEGKKQGIEIGGKQPPFALFGTLEEITNHINKYKEIGVSHVTLDIISKNEEEMFDMMEKISNKIMPLFKD